MKWPGTDGPMNKDMIIDVISCVYGISCDDLKSKVRSGDIVIARHTYFWICRKFISRSTHRDASNYVGRSTHNASMNGVSFIDDCIYNNDKYGSDDGVIKKLRVCLFILRLNYDI